MRLSGERMARIEKLVDPEWVWEPNQNGEVEFPEEVLVDALLDHIEEQWRRIGDDNERLQIIAAVVDGGMAWGMEARRIARKVEEEEMRKNRVLNQLGSGSEE